MDQSKEAITLSFHNRARDIFRDLLHAFAESAGALDRKTEEYRFIQLKESFSQTLKQQLEEAAQEQLQQHSHHRQVNQVNQHLQQLIGDYLHAFVRESRRI